MAEHIVISVEVGVPAAIAHMLGYHPSPGSVALLGLVDGEFDFALDIDTSTTQTGQWPDVIADVADIVAQQKWEIVLLAYGDSDTISDRAHAALRVLTGRGIRVRTAARLEDQRLYCLRCNDCDPRGFDASPSSEAMAWMVRAGFAPAPDRQAYLRQLDPVGPAHQLRMHIAVNRANDRFAALVADRHTHPAEALRAIDKAGIAAVDDAIAATRHRVAMTDDQAAWLLLMLLHLPVRDYAASASSESALAELWQDLLAQAPRGLQAAPACLLAIAALFDGRTALFENALARCLNDDPGYGLAHILVEAISRDVPADDLRTAIRKYKLDPDD